MMGQRAMLGGSALGFGTAGLNRESDGEHGVESRLVRGDVVKNVTSDHKEECHEREHGPECAGHPFAGVLF